MLSTAARVRALSQSFGRNVAFTTGQLLSCGSRNAIDIELCRLVKKGILKRLAAGVFILASELLEIPSAPELATLKAKRFGKRINSCKNSAAATPSMHYSTDGCKSSFDSVHGRIYFKHAAPGKFASSPSATLSEAHVNCNEVGIMQSALHENNIRQSQNNNSSHVLQMATRLFRLVFSLLENHQKRRVSVSFSRAILT